MRFETLTDDQDEALRQGASVLEADGFGDKVLLLADGRIMKLFRVRDAWSSARLFPYSKRFARNATLLTSLGIATVSSVRCFKLPSQDRTGVIYQPLTGETLRKLGVAGQLDAALCGSTGEFIASLHSMGILFRSIHLGNIVHRPEGGLGLIDIADLTRLPWSLSQSERLRNFNHLFRPPEDHDYLTSDHKQALIDRYLAACPAHIASKPRFQAGIEQRASG